MRTKTRLASMLVAVAALAGTTALATNTAAAAPVRYQSFSVDIVLTNSFADLDVQARGQTINRRGTITNLNPPPPALMTTFNFGGNRDLDIQSSIPQLIQTLSTLQVGGKRCSLRGNIRTFAPTTSYDIVPSGIGPYNNATGGGTVQGYFSLSAPSGGKGQPCGSSGAIRLVLHLDLQGTIDLN